MKLNFSTPQNLLVGSFASFIILGTFILWLPISHGRSSVSFVDALFTTTSAVCVTGLAVVDTGLDYSTFGQVIILLLIQGGGLGVMTFAGLAAMLFGHRLSLSSQYIVSDTFLQRDATDQFKYIFFGILKIVALIESIGALLLFLFLIKHEPVLDAAYSAIFHSISAFCNAGFSIYSNNLVDVGHNFGFIGVIMILIILGGLGHITLIEIWRKVTHTPTTQSMRFSFHSRLVLGISAFLIVTGALGIMCLNSFTIGTEFFEKFYYHALFQSVSARTAGFNTVDLGKWSPAPLFLVMILMFIGGSPSSCAGGVKTTTTGIWISRLWCRLIGRSDTVMFGRTISVETVRHVSVIFALALIWNVFGILVMLATEAGHASMQDIAFEHISAFGTVGLSTGITSKLTNFGKLWISLTMFIGRLGPLTLALWMLKTDKEKVLYPDVKVMIG